MRLALTLHPTSHCAAVTRIEVEVKRPAPDALLLRYFVTGQIRDIVLPPSAAPAHTDELWRRTCFEAFVREANGKAYAEFNFAPSSQWAAYLFDSHRHGMRLADVEAPAIAVKVSDQSFELSACVRLSGDAPWRLGLSAVIEETSGAKSLWALAHPPGQADFHHPDNFAYELPATEQT